jgi:hypothetical protein
MLNPYGVLNIFYCHNLFHYELFKDIHNELTILPQTVLPGISSFTDYLFGSKCVCSVVVVKLSTRRATRSEKKPVVSFVARTEIVVSLREFPRKT